MFNYWKQTNSSDKNTDMAERNFGSNQNLSKQTTLYLFVQISPFLHCHGLWSITALCDPYQRKIMRCDTANYLTNNLFSPYRLWQARTLQLNKVRGVC